MDRSTMALKLLIEGRPGVGKSTVLARLAHLLATRGVSIAGFVTEEIRVTGRRVGFGIRSLGGDQAVFAHVDFPGPVRVGRYGVDLDALERIALPTLQPGDSVLLIDELGKMELASTAFRDRVTAAFASARCVVATVHVFSHPFTDALKARADVSVVGVTTGNRDALAPHVADRITAECSGGPRA